MSANNYLPHLLVLPEDEKNRQILSGFRACNSVNSRQMPIYPVAKGWANARDAVFDVHLNLMRVYPERHLLLVIDFDNKLERRDNIFCRVPADLQDRFFILGCLDEPERLLKLLKLRPEPLGEVLASECASETCTTWGHKMLHHNADEIKRLKAKVKPFLFW